MLAIALLLLLADARPRAVAAAGNVKLMVYPNGKGSVTVQPGPNAPAPARCASSDDRQRNPGIAGFVCEYAYPRGTAVTLEAAPDDAQQKFQAWSHVSCPPGPRCTLRLTDDEEYVAAVFSPQTLLVTITGTGSVSTSDGRACPLVNSPDGTYLDCSPVPAFGIVTLVAHGNDPRWNADLCDAPPASSPAGPTCTILADRLRWASVGFGVDPPRIILPQPIAAQVKVVLGGDGKGRVSAGTKIDCPGTCTIKGTSGREERLTATESAGSRFDGWQRCVPIKGSRNECRARLAPGGTVKAVFNKASSKSGGSPTPSTSVSKISYHKRTGTRGKRRVHFAVDLGAPGKVRASLIRNKRNYARKFSRELGMGYKKLSLAVKSNAPKGAYRLKVTITGGAPKNGAFDVTLPR